MSDNNVPGNGSPFYERNKSIKQIQLTEVQKQMTLTKKFSGTIIIQATTEQRLPQGNRKFRNKHLI